MKTRIIGDPEVLERIKNSKPGDKSMYINMDAIRELPEEYEVVLTEIKIDIKKDFVDVGNGNFMPQPQLMYRIAEAKGIHGGARTESGPLIEDIDINPLLMAPIEQAPTMQRRTVGRSVKKYSEVMEEDGTLRRSSVCTTNYNVWERCLESWSKEEEQSDGYDAKKIKTMPNGNQYVEYSWYDKIEKETKTGKTFLKYQTPLRRKLHFDSEMKFAHAKAETKAHEKTIRELAGLMTGYTAEDLKEGRLVFAKVRRSADSLRLETAARLDAIRHGIVPPVPVRELFGPQDAQAKRSDIEFADIKDEPVKSAVDEMMAILNVYHDDKVIPADDIKRVESMMSYLGANPDADTAPAKMPFWKKCCGNLAEIEAKIPEIARLAHREFLKCGSASQRPRNPCPVSASGL